MVQALPKPVTFDEFCEWYPDTGVRYELHDGVIVEMNQPLGKHELIIFTLCRSLMSVVFQLDLPYGIVKNAFVKPQQSNSAYCPDVLLLNPSNLGNESLWETKSTLTQAASVPLVIEVVSSNWGIDYGSKAIAYESIGIPEYWIIDYLGLGSRRFIGNPKSPTLSIYSFVDDEYDVNQFRGNELILSPTFPELHLTAKEVLMIDE
ncbi:Uma2 family endonuclease [Cronbergia sp. UHCC 0137]|uniref:Uma2 family endonuclease n=1 Tax=Cronbergia sp. UHCC 0137 TaxID=3110239 RepID=UPI002B22181A|nr:Uma2 family endonuclease [Cronbergia sp. UHCC 0137]MEA5618227.1 Uma2 family endonuclease [Cronbergia sp. UHCC 0137]